MEIREWKVTTDEILKTQWMGSIAKWRPQKKDSVGWKTEQQKRQNFPGVNSRVDTVFRK